MSRIGLLAGYGKLPILFAERARAHGDTVIGFGITGMTDPAFATSVTEMHWIEWGALKQLLSLLRTQRIAKVIMLGKIKKDKLFTAETALDEEGKRLIGAPRLAKDKRDYSLLRAGALLLKGLGISVLPATTYLDEFVPRRGVVTARTPTPREWADIRYGRSVARHMARFDIGQTVVVKDKTVIAVEGVEGTDETIRRAGGLAGAGFSVVKCARPRQDMRFDVPLVGIDTVAALANAGGKVLALEAKKMFLIDREQVCTLANDNDISIVVI